MASLAGWQPFLAEGADSVGGAASYRLDTRQAVAMSAAVTAATLFAASERARKVRPPPTPP